eukprot:TRINITY_DN1662_c0_g1_i1.p1 TRINITY_DN1662_c0_g1~~TRINITY_DN1662_c0_g1_i1.p1  ORF type:complete len:529 (-),score=77.44 TRINITY_DN1662_c0_g1_i1:146-1681(-)
MPTTTTTTTQMTQHNPVEECKSNQQKLRSLSLTDTVDRPKLSHSHEVLRHCQDIETIPSSKPETPPIDDIAEIKRPVPHISHIAHKQMSTSSPLFTSINANTNKLQSAKTVQVSKADPNKRSSNSIDPFNLFALLTKKKEKKQPEPVIHYATCFADLPDDLKTKIKLLKLEEEKINQNFEHFIYILRHVTKESWRIPEADIPRSERTPNVSENLRQKALENITTIEKDDLKKIYKFIETSGKGGFGKVFCARERATKDVVAIKRLPAETDKEDICNSSEVACLMALKHPNIVEFKCAYKVNHDFWIVTEYMEGGTLSQAIKVHNLIEPHISFITKQLLNGLNFLHSKGFVHRDLKSNNIMMSITGNIKIIDFGLCAEVTNGPRLQMMGTAYWMPPEMIKKIPHTTKADLWCLGIVVLEMYFRTPPFSTSRILCMFKAICGETLEFVEQHKHNMSACAVDFVRKCLQVDPDARPTADELLKDPFVEPAALDKELLVVLKTIFVSITLYKSGI